MIEFVDVLLVYRSIDIRVHCHCFILGIFCVLDSSLCLHGSADPCEFLWFLFSLFACRLFIIFISHLAYCDFPSIPSSEYERTKLIPFGLLPTLHKTKEPMVMTLLPPHTYDIFCHGNDATNHMTQKFVRPLLQCSSEKLFLFVLCPSSHFSQTHHSNIF